MPFSEELVLSQRSLQDFIDCRRRFKLRFLDRLSWPAAISTPIDKYEYLSELGTRFHHLVHQHHNGLDASSLLSTLRDPRLQRWFENYLKFFSPGEKFHAQSEISLFTTLNHIRLVAKFDLVYSLSDETIHIVDWKTSQKPPDENWLAQRVQSILYPFVLAEAGKDLFPVLPPSPEKITLTYWFPENPQRPALFPYSEELHAKHADKLTAILESIQSAIRGDFGWDKTEQLDRCRFCIYRSHCDRGSQSGDLDQYQGLFDEDPETDLDSIDLGQIGEIRY
ncbi:MAG: PD-(D/E)XK nuclease family protein [Anaerolineales bacterium]|nr:PD-(D/E)XK nuclease family protein [Anaerolineales bacterium]